MPSLIGSNPDQLPTNGDLGGMAYQDPKHVNIEGGVAALDSLALPGGDAATLINSSLAFRNKLLNASFMVNQRGYTSGTNTSSGNEPTLDLWRVVTSGQNITFSDSGGVRTVTAPAGGMYQEIEATVLAFSEKVFVSGTYVLNWTGTATATIDGTPVAKGGTITLAGGIGVKINVKFTGGTVSNPQLEFGDTPTTFERLPFPVELQMCQRYFIRYTAALCNNSYFRFGIGGVFSSTVVNQTLQLPVQMWNTPVVSTTRAASEFAVLHGSTITACSVVPALDVSSSPQVLNVLWTVASGLTVGQCAALIANNNQSAFLDFTADL